MANESVLEESKQWYITRFRAFEDELNGGADTPFHVKRKQAITKFSELGFPTTRDEDWKYTNIAPIFKHKYETPASQKSTANLNLEPFMLQGLENNILVFVNGIYSPDLSSLNVRNDGLRVENLADAMTNEVAQTHFGKYAGFSDESFAALNTAFSNDGVFIHVAAGLAIDDVLHIIHLSDGKEAPVVAHPRNLIVLDDGAEYSVIESYHHLGGGTYFNNSVVEIKLGRGAKFEHIKIQEESFEAYHVGTLSVQQERESIFTSINVDLGGSLVRNNLNVLLNDRDCETHLLGFFLGSGTQLIDNHTFIDHAQPNCFSNELYKGILDDRAQGVFNGKILVRQDAQKTNALQSNKTILLTDEASINAKPQLEIFADDVKCTHGATIGQLDDEALFYLRARGIGKDMAEAMLRHAFVADVLAGIKDESLRAAIDHKIIKRFTS